MIKEIEEIDKKVKKATLKVNNDVFTMFVNYVIII